MHSISETMEINTGRKLSVLYMPKISGPVYVIPKAELAPGQKVLLYRQGSSDVITVGGRNLGKKRYVLGTGYVDDDGKTIKSDAVGTLTLKVGVKGGASRELDKIIRVHSQALKKVKLRGVVWSAAPQLRRHREENVILAKPIEE